MPRLRRDGADLTEHDHKYDEWTGEWNDEVDPSEWVPGDPLPGLWRGDFSTFMILICGEDEDLEETHDRGHCWCQLGDGSLGYKTYRWTPEMPGEISIDEVGRD